MKKRIALALGMILMIFVLSACGKTDPTTVDYNGTSYEELEQDMQLTVSMVMSISQYYSESGISADEVTKDVKTYLLGLRDQGIPITEEQINVTGRWDEIVEEFGQAKISGDENIPMDSFEVTKSGNTLTTDLTIAFEKKNVNFQIVYDYFSMEITGISIEPVYTMGEKMQKAGLNTLISMSIVFAVLILISLIIACFNIVPYLEKKKAEKLQADTQIPEAAPVVEKKAEKQQTDDGELIAVIAAAIAAGTGASTNEFVVRSIKRR